MKPFDPPKLPLEKIEWDRLFPLIGKANGAVARYDGLLQSMVNAEILLSPLTTQEAVLSSRIEGSQATLEDVLEYEAAQKHDDSKGEDIREIINYREAIRLAAQELKERPITLPLIRSIHNTLMDSVRGQEKGRGEFRKKQNWIGRPGDPVENASYVPPEPEPVNNSV